MHRPQTGYYDTLIQEAAALLESLVQNHPFVDGNKRVAFAVADVFLRINGYRITADSQGNLCDSDEVLRQSDIRLGPPASREV